MFTKRQILLTLLSLLVFGSSFIFVGLAMADNHPEYSIADYNKAKSGNKNLKFANLEETNLRGVDLKNANLYKADLEEADLEDADLRGANLRKADLESANLRGAKIDGANFAGAELEDAIWPNGKVCAEESVGQCR